MADLWKALGDVYGDNDADAADVRPVKVEPAADQLPAAAPVSVNASPSPNPTALPLDDDLAAALSAALVNAPSAPVTTTGVAAPILVPAPPAPPAPPAQERVAHWISEIETRQDLREKGPDLEAALPDGPTWTRTDDDILPSGKLRKGR